MTLLLVSLVSFTAAAVNAIAGGGTFLTFPALTGIAKLSEKVANMTSTIGLWPGAAASVAAAKDEFHRLPRGMVIAFSIISLVGGALGSWLLIETKESAFRLVIPWLLAFATGIFAFSKPIARWAGRKHGDRSLKWTIFVGSVQFAVAVYGGYFGAGIGVLMLAGLSFAGLDDIHQMNGLKVLLAAMINGISAVIFVLYGAAFSARRVIDWKIAGLMAVASIAGGFLGMVAARKVKADQLRMIILGIGVALSAYYFWNAYGR
ncbi:MAG TPA: sulfite exporter TauE/SafE family protein [Tepidisphaeraceae bacterium]|jgi:uncharacterized membrane protein YfcA|nr:sulfite exporter TauE/SafE family protein [Tepidisphaeraceae bacterium]